MDEDLELLQDFRTESLEHMGEIEPLFIDIESLEGDEQLDVVNQIFRAAHSVKGAAGFFGLDRIQNLAHTMENLLMRVRDGELEYHAGMTDALLEGVDKLTQLIAALPEAADLPIEEEVARLTPLIEGQTAGEPASVPVPPSVPVASEVAPTPPATTTDRPDMSRVPDANAGEQSVAAEAESQTQTVTEADDEKTGASTDRLSGGGVFAPAKPRPEPARRFEVAPEAAEEAARFGQRIFGVILPDVLIGDGAAVAEATARLSAVGKVVGAAVDSAEGRPFGAQVASVLEPDLFPDAVGVDAAHVTLLRDRVEMSPERMDQVMAAKHAPARSTAASSAKPAGGGGDGSSASAPGGPGGIAKPAPKKKVEAMETVRVSVDLLDKLMDLAGELVLGRNQLLARLDDSEDPGIKGVLQNLDIVTSDMQNNIMNTRMQQVGNVFKKYHRVVRDLSRKLGKRVELEIEGSEVELDKSIIELLSDPLTHLVRNSLDHGLEPPVTRLEAGKPEVGRIRLSAYHESGQVNIEISDDGKGIDPQKTRAAAVKRDLLSQEEANALSDADAVALIFSPGFSLAAEVTEVSGRGVGMDVVRANITKLGGNIEVESEVGMGTTLRIRLPLTLAIVPSLIVVVDEERFAVPQVNLVEIVRVKPDEIEERLENIKGADVLRLRGRLLPLVRLADVLDIPRHYICPETNEKKRDRRRLLTDRRNSRALPPSDEAPNTRRGEERRAPESRSAIHVVVLRAGEHRYGLVVDRIADSEEIVVKPLSAFVKGCRCYAGATIMGDGRVAMILDVAGIASESQLQFHDVAKETNRRELATESQEGLSRRELILFANAESEQFAVDLEQIVRLEKIAAQEIESIGGAEYMKYLGKGLPLVRLENELTVSPIEESDEFYVLIPNANGSAGGILASRVIDTVDTEIAIEHAGDDPECVNGRALIQGRLTTILDAERLLGAALGGSQ